ncbi:glycosyltransferase [Solirubrobacter ginsenosidimutans]|uniref:Glycosyltransferase n=1 Tax=Solirubrobacter ginsenosidimutans TaxID=490573 RepID=A0A9X3N4M7_9ACTN|nr:glycosyltransferase [Solirubrobacter ginsenosidimutans]MDA0164723.1 glycosyltransferase [Solirubrobacter ginsenosidimutans]
MTRVLFYSHDPVGERMAGLGIRTFELARVLADHAEVTIAHGGDESGVLDGLRTVAVKPHAAKALRPLIARADVVVTHPVWSPAGRWLRRSGKRIVHDLYDPETLETLELSAGSGRLARRALTDTTLDRLHDALRTGHHFMCAGERQRDLWLGAMLGLRLIGADLYDRDPSLRSVIDLVPFGVPVQPPVPTGPGPRAIVGDEAEIVLWNGGIWNWLDAETAIRAVAALAERRPRVQLVFMGSSDQVAARRATERAHAVAKELRAPVHFHAGWIPYAERAAWLTQADCAISTQREHLETRFAFRTRILDCFWAGLPVVCTAGDDLADRVERQGLGEAIAPGDADAAAAAIERVLDRGRAAYAEPLRQAAAAFAWPVAAQPLVQWVTSTEPLTRPGDTPGRLKPSAAHRARTAAYELAGRPFLARR